MNQHCPHCHAVIFRAAHLDEHAFDADASDPLVYRSGAGFYADCPDCGQPVPMEAVACETGLTYRTAHARK